MATSSMDKGLYAAPLGRDEEEDVGVEIGIEAVLPLDDESGIEIEELEDGGGLRLVFGPSKK